ncbi:hypothetical protein RIVM261_079940 [Rivularia sp. IAM M-261]|nr:hypothetical protein RIVM261_079940 [Rivularia sp. IAM M-261]
MNQVTQIINKHPKLIYKILGYIFIISLLYTALFQSIPYLIVSIICYVSASRLQAKFNLKSLAPLNLLQYDNKLDLLEAETKSLIQIVIKLNDKIKKMQKY